MNWARERKRLYRWVKAPDLNVHRLSHIFANVRTTKSFSLAALLSSKSCSVTALYVAERIKKYIYLISDIIRFASFTSAAVLPSLTNGTILLASFVLEYHLNKNDSLGIYTDVIVTLCTLKRTSFPQNGIFSSCIVYQFLIMLKHEEHDVSLLQLA